MKRGNQIVLVAAQIRVYWKGSECDKVLISKAQTVWLENVWKSSVRVF